MRKIILIGTMVLALLILLTAAAQKRYCDDESYTAYHVQAPPFRNPSKCIHAFSTLLSRCRHLEALVWL
jgi:hypothetical protein